MKAAGEKFSYDVELAKMLANFYGDPLGYVMFCFPWDSNPEIQLVELQEPWRSRYGCKWGPDKWACEFLDEWGKEIRARKFDGRKAVPAIQFSTASGHGIGKSTLTAWIIKFIMDTRPFAKGTVTAGTDTQLRTKTWAELGKWHRLSLTRNWFQWNTGRGAMSLVHKKFPHWACSAQTCREENSEAFAGQHAANATSFYVFDEASQIPDKIYEVRDGGTLTGEAMTFDFGNPTRNSGRFFEQCVGKLKHRYLVRMIDSRSVAITNKERMEQWRQDHGEESDYFKVRVRGMFPSKGSAQFIPTADVIAAASRDAFVDRTAPLIIGVDVARFGDDSSVIYPRLGMDARSFAPTTQKGIYKGLDTVQLAGKVKETISEFKSRGKNCTALFVDGGGIGGGVVDQLRHAGYGPIEIQFGGKPVDDKVYRFKVDEMWGGLREALAGRLAIPPETEETGAILKEQLTQREFSYTLLGNKINLESKKDMKERLGGEYSSPDEADALALTFAQDIAVDVGVVDADAEPKQAEHEYDPYGTED